MARSDLDNREVKGKRKSRGEAGFWWLVSFRKVEGGRCHLAVGPCRPPVGHYIFLQESTPVATTLAAV